MRGKHKSLFWISFADIMTSLFFIMLILFAAFTYYFNNKVGVLQEERKQVEAIQNSTRSLDPKYFEFDSQNKRYRLNIDVTFQYDSDDILTIGDESLESLVEAGENLYSKVDSILNQFDNAYLILLIEGNTQKVCTGINSTNCNYILNPNGGYNLSYRRALALVNYWKSNGINFYDFGARCEVIIAGSGYFGLSRTANEELNRRFTLQLTPKWTLDNLSNDS